jgi:methionine aminopeptidase
MYFYSLIQNQFTISENQVFCINVCMSSGKGDLTASSLEPTLMQRNVELTRNLRMKSARRVLSTAMNHFSVFPFSTRALLDLDESDAALHKLGLPEAKREGVLIPLGVMEDKTQDVNGDAAVVAQFKMTVLVTKNGVMNITAGPELLGLPYCHSDYSLGGEFEQVLSRGVREVKAIRSGEAEEKMQE